MDTIIARIKEYALIIDPTLEDNDFLDLLVHEVVDRALAYMNRYQLIAQYELDLEDTLVEEVDYELPIPTELERVLAGVVVGCHRNSTARASSDTGAITSISDNGQSITYSEQVINYLNSSDDSKVFSGSKELLDRYILPTIVENTIYTQNQF